MRTNRLWVPAGLVVVAGLAAVQQGTASPERAVPGQSAVAAEKLLTIVDVEKVAGLKGVKLVPRDPMKGAGGDLNFARPDGNLLVMAILGSTDMLWKGWQQQIGFGPKSDVGDEAFEGRDAPFVLVVRKGTRAFSLSSFFDPELMAKGNMTPLLNPSQLRELAKIIVSRF